MHTLSQKDIPVGNHCYSIKEANYMPIKKRCPYWIRDASKPDEQSGYCCKLKWGDWHLEESALWDGVKVCNYNRNII